MQNAIETFFSAWSMTDQNERFATVSKALTETATYADPRTEKPLTDATSIADYIGKFSAAAPGATVKLAKSDVQNDLTRATILFVMADGMQQSGQYFIERAADGRINRMTGFVGTGEVS